MNLKLATIGTDPETLLFSRKANEICSAIDLIPEGKDEGGESANPPRDLGNGYKVLHDNVLLEFNVPPSNGSENFVEVLREGFRRIYKEIGDSYDIIPIASHSFNPKYLDNDEARRFGCSPEMCAYDIMECTPPDCPETFRSAGAHIHIGRNDFKQYVEVDDLGNVYPKEDCPDGLTLIDPYSKLNVIKLMDLFVGLPLTYIDTAEESKARKRLYGMSGRHRPTAFGVEYRMPSNYWVSSPALTDLIYQLTMLALQTEIDGNFEKLSNKMDLRVVRRVLDSGDDKKAAELIKKLNLPNNILHFLNLMATNRVSPYELKKSWGLS